MNPNRYCGYECLNCQPWEEWSHRSESPRTKGWARVALVDMLPEPVGKSRCACKRGITRAILDDFRGWGPDLTICRDPSGEI